MCWSPGGGREREIQLPVFIHLQHDILVLGRLKTLEGDADGVGFPRHQRNQVVAALIGFGVANSACVLGNRLHQRSRYGCA